MISNSSLAGFSRKYFDGVRDLTGTMGALASTGVMYGLTKCDGKSLKHEHVFGQFFCRAV